MQKHLLLWCVALLCANTLVAQESKVQSLLIVPSGEAFGTVINSPTALVTNLTFTLPTTGGTLLVTPSAGVSNAWLLGGNDLTSTPLLNQLGTTSAHDLQLVAGGATNVRLTLDDASAAVTVNNGGELRLEENGGTDYSSFKAGAQTGNLNYTLPVTAPTTNQVLTATAVSGSNVTLGWATSSGGGSATTSTMGADFNIVDNATLTDVTGLTVAVSANTTYEVMVRIQIDETGTTDRDLRLVFVAPTGAYLYLRELDAPANAGSSTTSADNRDFNQDRVLVYGGFMRVEGTSGNLKVQAALENDNGGADTWDVKAGSFISIKQW